MASSPPKLIMLSLIFVFLINADVWTVTKAQVDHSSFKLVTSNGLTPWTPDSVNDELDAIVDDDGNDEIDRRWLYRKHKHYFISYGALSANRIPCPPRSGRSYYTDYCSKARGPVHPYTRGCSSITRCRR